MPEITITEGLAEIKLIGDRVSKKQEFVASHLVRPKNLIDPLQEQGGSVKILKQEMQSIIDLGERLVSIRRAISLANQTHKIEITGINRTIADWLTWRRDVYPDTARFLNVIAQTILRERRELGTDSRRLRAAQEITGEDIEVHINEKALFESIETLSVINNHLDGQLSLKNAQIMIKVP